MSIPSRLSSSKHRLALFLLLFATLAVSSTAAAPAGADDSGGVPAMPTGLSVSTEQGSLDVSVDWDDVDGAGEYLVRWRLSGPDHKLNEGVRGESSSATITVDGYGEWVVRVQACNDAGCGNPQTQRFKVEPAPEPTPEPTPEPIPEPTPEPTPEPAAEPLQVSISAGATVVPVGKPVTLKAVITGPAAESEPSYQWELDLGDWYSAGTDATLSYLSSVAESQAFRVTVTYGMGDSATSDPLTVNWVELPDAPALERAVGRQQSTATADAGPDQEVQTGAMVTLDGSGSSSTTSGATLTYAWTQTGGATVTLDDAAAQMPSFTAPSVRRDLEFSLVVNDGTNASSADTVSVAVRPPLNPTSAPCPHPSGGSYTPNNNLVSVTGTTNSTISFRGVGQSGNSVNDLWFCWPDGTSNKRADGVNNQHIHTERALDSGTGYWVLALWREAGLPDSWTDWVAATTTGGASVRGARFTSSPATGDTYRIGETIQAQVTWSRTVTVANGGADRNVSLRLDLGADDSTLTDSRRKMIWTGEGSGTDTLTFEYVVGVGGTDTDTDGVWLQTASATDNTVVFLESVATITGGNPASNTAVRTRVNMPTTGDAGRKVDGTSTATAHAGPDQEVMTGTAVTLDGSGSSTLANPTFTYAWTQTGGVTVTLDDATAQMPSFTAPSVRWDLEFALVVNDGTNPSTGDTVSVAVRPPLNPTSVPCPHPSGGAYTPDNALVTVTGTTNSAISFRGVGGSGGSLNDLWFCWPDGTSSKGADDVNNQHIHTQGGLDSGTRYWVLVLWWEDGIADSWTDWVARTTTGGASIRGARFTSSPAYDADRDGTGDSYLVGETIQAQVTWSQPVTVDAKGDDANVFLGLDLGADDSNHSNSRRKMVWTGEGSGTDTLTFEYTVQRLDKDPDGVWLHTASTTDDTVVFLSNGATITGGNPATNTAVRTRAGLSTTGDAGRKVGLTSSKLVGKNLQTHGNFTSDFTGDYAQQITTGDDGYKITRVAIRMSSTAASAPVYTVSIHKDSGDGTSSRPAGRLALLQNPSGTVGAEGLYSFSVPGNGIDLRANTRYWVVIDVSTGTSQSLVYTTSSPAHDTGSMEGWSITHGHVQRDNSETEWAASISSLRLEVHGYAKLKAEIELVRFVSAPTYDSDDDGVRDTFVMGDKVLVDVEFSEPVVVPGTGPQLRLNLGMDGSGASKTMDMESVLHGGMTVRFAYTVTTSDSDTDGLFVETLESGQLFFGPGSATAVKSVETGASVNMNKTGMPGTGNLFTKADGSKTSSDRGPVPTGATVNGAVLTVTYDRSLNTSVDTAKLDAYFSVRGAGSVGAGNRNGYQHPSVVSVTGDSNEKLQLTLGDPARAGDTVWLTYKLEAHVGLLKGAGASGKMAPAFVDLAVTNSTPGPAGPAPWHATVKGTDLTLVFDGALDGDTRNQQIEVEYSNVQQVEGERDGLEATVESLRAERDGLEATVESLQGERDGLEATVESLQGERDGLEATVESLQDEQGGLAASYSVLRVENSGLKATLQTLEVEKASLETQVEEFKLAHGSVTQLEERAEGLRAVIAGLEEDRRALQVSSSEMFPNCTGSMEPGITCLDTVVVLQNFRPEDIAVNTVISFYPPDQAETGDGPPVLHRVTDIKIEDDVHYFWPKGDALDEPDGHWISKDNVLGYVIELQQGTRPENAALRERVNGAREQYVSTRGKMLEARDKYDDTLIRHCGSVAAASSCATSQENLAEIRAAYDTFSGAWGEYLNAVCGYDKAYYHGTHESEPLTGQMFEPYAAPSACSQGG